MTFPHDADLRALAASQAPSEREVEGLEQRVLARLDVAPRRRGVGVALAVGALAVALALLFARAERSPEPIALSTGEVALAPGVHATAAGAGTATTRGGATEVLWTAGTLVLAIDPAAGADVVVRTPEGSVRVRGTRFTVLRDAFGTEVRVERGEVQVACTQDAAPRALGATGAHTCLRDAAAGLGRVLRLEAEGAPAAVRLAAIERALAHPTGGEGARAALGERRHAALAELAAERLTAGDCAGALPWLAILRREGDADAAAAEARCAGR